MRDAAATIRAAWFFAAPVVGLAVLAYLTWGRNVIRPDLAITIGIAIVIVVAVVLLSFTFGPQLMDWSPYEIVTLGSTLLVERAGNHHKYTNSREVVIKARRDGVRLVEFPWFWTGQSKEPSIVKPLFASQVIFDGLRQEDSQRIYRWIYLGRALSAGEGEKAGITVVVQDDAQHMNQFFNEGPTEPVRHLQLTLKFPRDEDPEIVEQTVVNKKRPGSPMVVTNLNMTRNQNSATGTVDYTINVDKPKRYHRYGFRWK